MKKGLCLYRLSVRTGLNACLYRLSEIIKVVCMRLEMLYRFVFWLGMNFAGQALAAQAWLETRALPKESAQELLQRFGLETSPTNWEKFASLNKIGKNDPLQTDATYILPIQKYVYNGKNIRTTIGISDFEQAKRIEAYNLELENLGVKSGSFKAEKGELWVAAHLTSTRPEKIDLAVRNTNFPIFGDAYKQVKIKDLSLKNKVYYIIAGHGGADSGARAEWNGKQICEDEYAYDISLRVARLLLERGALVYILVRDKNDGIREDEYLQCDEQERVWGDSVIPLAQQERLAQRSRLVRGWLPRYASLGEKAQCTVEIHIDSRDKTSAVDLFMYYFPGDFQSEKLGKKVQNVFRKKYAVVRKHQPYEGKLEARDLHTLRETGGLRLFVEVGNIQHFRDQKRIVLPRNRQLIAEWLVEGLAE
jgi:N-acetylmuramoyl-L-alanine amidase